MITLHHLKTCSNDGVVSLDFFSLSLSICIAVFINTRQEHRPLHAMLTTRYWLWWMLDGEHEYMHIYCLLFAYSASATLLYHFAYILRLHLVSRWGCTLCDCIRQKCFCWSYIFSKTSAENHNFISTFHLLNIFNLKCLRSSDSNAIPYLYLHLCIYAFEVGWTSQINNRLHFSLGANRF